MVKSPTEIDEDLAIALALADGNITTLSQKSSHFHDLAIALALADGNCSICDRSKIDGDLAIALALADGNVSIPTLIRALLAIWL